MKGYEFLPEAEEEMNEAARFYERRKKALGLKFLNAVERTIISILAPAIRSGTFAEHPSPHCTRFPLRGFVRDPI